MYRRVLLPSHGKYTMNWVFGAFSEKGIW